MVTAIIWETWFEQQLLSNIWNFSPNGLSRKWQGEALTVPETNYKDCFWSHSLLHMFWLWMLECRAYGTDVRRCDGRGNPGTKQEIWGMGRKLNRAHAMWFKVCTEPFAVAPDGTTVRLWGDAQEVTHRAHPRSVHVCATFSLLFHWVVQVVTAANLYKWLNTGRLMKQATSPLMKAIIKIHYLAAITHFIFLSPFSFSRLCAWWLSHSWWI